MNIGMVTGGRSEWGILFPLAKQIAQHDDCHLELFITGSHLSTAHGNTYVQVLDEIDALDANAQRLAVAMHLVVTQAAGDSKLAVCQTIAKTIEMFGDKLRLWDLECLVVLGDRYESFAAATAAHIVGLPIVHIHGGEVTEGAYDDSLRHSITKMSSLHLVATELYGRRVVQLGESPDSVFNCGALGVEALDDYRNSAKKDERSVVVCWHPVTLEPDLGMADLKAMMSVLYEKDFEYTIIAPNADNGRKEVDEVFMQFARDNYQAVDYYNSLPRDKFLNKLASAKFIIGNSSAGIIEAPALGVPTINVGSRQCGRMMASSVMQADTSEDIARCIEDAETRMLLVEKAEIADGSFVPYGRGGPVAKTMLDTILANKHILDRRKVFHDIQS